MATYIIVKKKSPPKKKKPKSVMDEWKLGYKKKFKKPVNKGLKGFVNKLNKQI